MNPCRFADVDRRRRGGSSHDQRGVWLLPVPGPTSTGTSASAIEEHPVAHTENSGQRLIKMRQIDECSLAQYSWTDDEGTVHDDSSKMYERKKPKCRD